MKKLFFLSIKTWLAVLVVCTCTMSIAQDNPEPKKKAKPVKNTFDGQVIGDVQTVMVPIKGTFSLDIMHRFGTWKNGYEDFFGLFAPSNIRLGASYSICNNFTIGAGITKANMIWNVEGKAALLRQTKGKYPVSITYYGNVEIDSRKPENFIYRSDRLSYFHQVLIARKFSNNLSLQFAPSLAHVNSVEGYYSAPGKVSKVMNHEQLTFSFTAKYKLKETMAVFCNYDQPITRHQSNNPHPNLQLGMEMTTSAHSFQFFAGNYAALSSVRNAMFNNNNYRDDEFLIGFNISRRWNY